MTTLFSKWHDSGHDFMDSGFGCRHCEVKFELWADGKAPLLCPVNNPTEVMSVERLNQCATKRSYCTYEDADDALVRSRRRDDKTPGLLHVYRCKFCPSWHIGHKSLRESKS